MMKCTKCNSEYLVQTSTEGSKHNLRCKDCGHETWIMVLGSTNEFEDSLNSPGPCFQLVGRWPEEPAVQQLADVIELIPELKEVGFEALWRQAVESVDIDFGVFTQDDVEYLETVLPALGLEIKRTAYEFPVKV